MKKSLGSKTNSLVFPTAVLIECTYDESGKPNAMNACWAGICSSSPASMAVSMIKATYSYHNITYIEVDYYMSENPVAVPEPLSLYMLCGSAIGLLAYRRRFCTSNKI